MTTQTDIVNRALQIIGTRTTITDSELANNSSNEAIQANLVMDNIRRRLLRLAPWNCSLITENLIYISSVPGTPENTSMPASNLWEPGLPTPPWAYEYQYPVDCLRACWIIPATQTGFAGGVPITTAVTGGAPSFWLGPPIKFKVQADTFRPVTAVEILSGGSGHSVGEVLTFPAGPNTSMPIGAPCQVRVTSVDGGGAITGLEIISVIPDSILGGSYFNIQANPIALPDSGATVGPLFNITQGPPAQQRVILTNQEFATLVYCKDVTDPNVMDDLFQDAWVKILAATLTMALKGDAKVANFSIQQANSAIMEARAVDGNEGLTINDTTPDWIRIRGVDFPQMGTGPYLSYDWGNLWPTFG